MHPHCFHVLSLNSAQSILPDVGKHSTQLGCSLARETRTVFESYQRPSLTFSHLCLSHPFTLPHAPKFWQCPHIPGSFFHVPAVCSARGSCAPHPHGELLGCQHPTAIASPMPSLACFSWVGGFLLAYMLLVLFPYLVVEICSCKW